MITTHTSLVTKLDCMYVHFILQCRGVCTIKKWTNRGRKECMWKWLQCKYATYLFQLTIAVWLRQTTNPCICSDLTHMWCSSTKQWAHQTSQFFEIWTTQFGIGVKKKKTSVDFQIFLTPWHIFYHLHVIFQTFSHRKSIFSVACYI